MNEVKKIELITEIETDNKTVLFDHIQENEKDFEEVRLNIEELENKLQNIQLTPGDKGDKGDTGLSGLDGKDGKTPVAGIDFPLPENGKDGYTPIKGVDYFDGKDGKDGVGIKGDKGDKPKHRWKDTKLQFEKPDGTWGQLVDLRGLQGQIGLPGGSLGASYPSVHLNNELLTTGVRDLNFSGGITATVTGTKVDISTDDLSGYVPYTGANQTVNLNFQDLSSVDTLSANVGLIDYLTVDFINIDANEISSPAQPIIIDSANSFTLKLSGTTNASVDSDGFHIGNHSFGSSTAVPLFLYDNYGAGVKLQTSKMASSGGYNAIFPDPDQVQENFYFLLGSAKGASKKISVYTGEYTMTSYDSFGFNSAANTLTIGDSTTQGSIELINSTRTTTLKAPATNQTLTFPSIPVSTQVMNITSGGVMGTYSLTGSAGSVVMSNTPTITTPAITTSAIITRTSLGSTPNYGLYLRNTTASTSGATVQFSPAIQFFGSGWDTDGSTSVGLTGQVYLSTVSGTTVKSQLRFDMDESGGGSDTKMRLTNTGQLGIGINVSNPQADLSIGGNGVAGTGLYVGGSAYGYRQAVIADGDGEELFAVYPQYMSDGTHKVALGDVNDAYNYCRLEVVADKTEIINGDLKLNDTSYGNIILGTTTGTKFGTSSSQKLSFFGATPVVRQSALTTQLTTITYTEPGTPDYAIQNMTNSSPYGFVTQDEANTLLKVVKNLQTRVSELETRLSTYGLLP